MQYQGMSHLSPEVQPEVKPEVKCFQYTNCVRNNCLLPMSVILINDQNGSRTIVHHRGAMPEISLEDFQKLDLNDYRMVNHSIILPSNGLKCYESKLMTHKL